VTYFFSGVFVLGDGAGAAERICTDFGGRVGEMERPIPGWVVAFAADYNLVDAPPEFDEALVKLSASFPGCTFIRLTTSCWGGSIDFEEGKVFRGGDILAEERAQEDIGYSGDHSIIEPLFARAGVRLESGFLEPLTRGWFDGRGDAVAAFDRTSMRVALEVARARVGLTGDNPSVGCVLIAADGFSDILAHAATADGGRPHAEEIALAAAGERARGATAYVTLEPCAKRTSGAMSCADLLIQAGVARVVIAASDPHPFASGVGVERLRAAGISVEAGLLASEARRLNADFHRRWTQS
jgi:diaminohydroxyphosphoribosylaminopyrimidine deaminase/5-amino-6-(5-phosphoribosylamino)uracil reductase